MALNGLGSFETNTLRIINELISFINDFNELVKLLIN